MPGQVLIKGKCNHVPHTIWLAQYTEKASIINRIQPQPKRITSTGLEGYLPSIASASCQAIVSIDFQPWLQLPEAATSAMGLFVMLAMNPTMEKMTKPANMLVKEFMQQTMTESLNERDKTKRQPLSRWYQFLISQSHIVVWGGGSSHFVYCSSTEAVQNYVDWYSGAGGIVIKIAGIRDKHDGAVHRLTQTSDSADIRKKLTQLEPQMHYKNWQLWLVLKDMLFLMT